MIPSSQLTIRLAEAGDETHWKSLWRSYLTFCKAELDDDITDLTWQRGLDPTATLQIWVAVVDNAVTGFAVCVLHDGTWTRTPICYLEDLFVGNAHRGLGIGRALLTNLVDHAKTSNWARLYWHTKNDNAVARQLYDSFTEADTLVRYRLLLNPPSS